MKRWMILILLALAVTLQAHGKEAVPVAENPALEARLTHLTKTLRCLVCQNETLADSQADLALDLRKEIREMMLQGKSDKEITDYLTQRYGDFVLYRPPVKPTTWLLWFGPFLILFGALAGLVYFLKHRRKALPDEALSEDELARVKALLGSDTPLNP
jgi:cytochrome c-type biogenesis protein CcmH